MKKTIVISLFVLATMACHRKTVASSTAAVNSEKAKSDAAHAELVVQGKTVYTTRCNKCHALKTVENYTADRWGNILKSMVPKAKLNDAEAQQVTAYVLENAKK
jgi:mono/diheme cytochrome c family protein